MFRTIFGRSQRSQIKAASPRRHLSVEILEERVVPTQWLWTNQGGAGDGLWTTGANWTDLVNSSSHAVPGSSDYVLFGTGGGSNTSCTLSSNTTVDRVTMDA